MRREINFSRFVGIAVVIICIWIVVLALLSAIMKNENNDNIIYVDSGLGTTLNIAKSNLVTNNVDIQKDIEIEDRTVSLSIRLPKINIETKTVSDINDKIYAIYQDVYSAMLKDENVQKVDIDYNYNYNYLEDDTIIEITIVKKITKDYTVEETDIKFVYDVQNDIEK